MTTATPHVDVWTIGPDVFATASTTTQRVVYQLQPRGPERWVARHVNVGESIPDCDQPLYTGARIVAALNAAAKQRGLL